MLRLFLSAFLFLFPCFIFLSGNEPEKDTTSDIAQIEVGDTIQALYQTMHLDSLVSLQAFRQAVSGYYKIAGRKREILTLIDFSKPSTENRLFVFDMHNHKLLFCSLVAHGRNSGGLYATSFSNQSGSNKSSLGFYLTEETYQGNNGYSLRLKGLEKGINDKARERAIVVHGASYAHPSVLRSGRLGRSFGCPAVPHTITHPLINTIKEGSVMFIYAPVHEYLAHSTILKSGPIHNI